MVIRTTLYILLFLLASIDAAAQRLTLSRIDTTGYPIMKGLVYALDASGKPLGGLSAGDLALTENGEKREILSVDCPSSRSFRAISSVLTIDISGSMRSAAEGSEGSTTPNIVLARAAAAAWISALPDGESECAITSFDSQSLINQDFTRDRSKLLAAVQSLAPDGGTSYDAGLISTPAGALGIAAGGDHRRIVVFLTDGLGGGSEEAIVAAAQKIDATIFCVTLGMPAPDVLKQIARRTGGEFFENVTTVEEAESIYHAILYRAGGGEPCEITWRDQPGCATDRELSLSMRGRSAPTTFQYTAPASAIGRLVVQPPALAFKTTAAGSAQVTLRAVSRPITIRSIEPAERSTAFSLEGVSTPFTLAPGESRTITVRYQPGDGRYAYNRWKIESDACSGNMIFASGGASRAGSSQQPALHLVRPDGGEVFRAGEETTIAWEGIGAGEPVRLDYSTNSGESWTTIAQRTSGLTYRWTVPATPSTKCLARVTTVGDAPGGPASSAELRGLSSFSTTPDGSRLVSIARAGDYLVDTIVIWDLATGRRLQSFPFREKGREAPTPGREIPLQRLSYSPDGNFIIVETMGSRIYLFDPATGKYLWKFDGSLLNDVVQQYQGNNSFYSPDASRLIVKAYEQPELVVLDLMSGEKIISIPTPGNQISTVAFTPDGSQIVTTPTKNTAPAQLWSAETGQLVHTFNATGATHMARPAGDGSTIMTVSGDWRGDTIFTWNRSSGARLGSVPAGRDAFLSPDAATAIIWPKGLPTLIDARTGAVIHRLHQAGAAPVESGGSQYASFSEDGSLVAIYGRKKVEVWDTRSGTRVKEFTQNTEYANRVRISPDNATVVWNRGWNLDVVRLEKTVTIQEDRSDRVWSIVVDTRPTARDVDFGARQTGSTTDSIVSAFIRNEGTGTLTVDAIAIGGANASEFALVSGIAPFEVPAGKSHTVEFRFTPTSTGRKMASIEIDAGGRRLTQSLRGEGVRPQLVVETGLVDFDKVLVGTIRDTNVQVVLRNVGTARITIREAELVGPDTSQFTLVDGGGSFTLAPGDARPIALRFAPVTAGRTSSRLMFRQSGSARALFADIYGNGIGLDDDERYTDPTTFRTIAAPNAVIPKAGTIVAGSYDIVGLMAGYAVTDNVMILAGGGLPLPDDWGGVKGSMYGAYSLGVKAGFRVIDRLDFAAGFQWGRSMFDQEATPGVTESEITANVPYLALSYGDDDSRVSATYGYAWKHHAIITGEFDVEAGIISVGGDYRFANRWKGVIEVLSMKTLGYIPIAATARYFGHTWALDIGAAYLGVGDGPELPVAPVVSYVMVF